MDISLDPQSGHVRIAATAAEIAKVISYALAITRGRGLNPQAAAGQKLIGHMGTIGESQGILLDLKAPETESNPLWPTDDAADLWAHQKALASTWTFPQCLDLRKLAKTDARADFLFELENRTCTPAATFLDAINSIPSENPPGISEPPPRRDPSKPPWVP